MKIAYFDCFCGAAGDMIVAACLDAGVPAEYLREELNKLGLPEEMEYGVEKVKRAGIAATQFLPKLKTGPKPKHIAKDSQHPVHGAKGRTDAGAESSCEHHHHAPGPALQTHPHNSGKHHHESGRHVYRGLPEITAIIQDSGLRGPVKERACQVFETLARAEAKVHGKGKDEIHFHEVGGIDSIADIVGACIALDYLQVDEFYCSPLVVGGGTVQCEHGLIPVPAPATAELIKGIEIRSSPIRKELLTPTGAAILTSIVDSFGPLPACCLSSIGYGAGTRDFPGVPNVLRLLVGTRATHSHEPSN